MALCADICNATKHLGLDLSKFPAKSGAEPQFGAREYHLTFGSVEPNISLKVSIAHDGATLGAYSVAVECVSAWQLFLN